MHQVTELLVFWAVAFLTLFMAVVLLSVFCDVIESDMELLGLVKEAMVAIFASLIEAVGLWMIVSFIPAAYNGLALRAMIIPIIMVALIYRIAHLDSWSVFEAGLLLAFQAAIGCLVASLLLRHFQTAIMILVAFGICLVAIAVIAKSLSG